MTTSSYFSKLNLALKEEERAIPFALIDLDLLDKNIEQLKVDLDPDKSFRLVAKSLPAYGLLEYVMAKMKTKKLMVFHQPFLSQLSLLLDDEADILIGKPMPLKTADYFYAHFDNKSTNFDPFRQIQWLVDTRDRIEEYIHLASRLGQKLRLNLEIDVGLHRGGFKDKKTLKSALNLLAQNEHHVEFSGFMGYDPHIVKIPKLLRPISKSLKLSQDFYKTCIELLKNDYPKLYKGKVTFNGAGSPTLKLHKKEQSVLNDVSAGSCLLKPRSFDIPSLSNYTAATFIATPVLKKFEGTNLPALERIKAFLNLISARNRTSFFIYGGFWKADFCYPKDAKVNSIFGASTNQSMINTAEGSSLNVDDFVFLRPHQSEFVLLQFGQLLTIRNGQLSAMWKPFKN